MTQYLKALLPLLLLGALTVNAFADAPVRRALLIGIDEYASPNIPDLNGAVNDVDMMRQVLQTRLGFAPAQIDTLRNEAATRDAIVAALQALADKSQRGDVIYIHFSGHGSQTKDLSGDESEDQMDETIVPHDGRTANIADISDDELAGLLAGLKTTNVVLVLDSCHSGTGIRGIVRKRSIGPDSRSELYAQQTRAIVTLEDNGVVLLTGAAAHQSALDGPLDGKSHGFFSYALGKAFDVLGGSATPQSIHEQVNVEFGRIKQLYGGMTLPEPQIEASAAKLGAALLPGLLQAVGLTTTSATPTVTDRAHVPVRSVGNGEVVLVGGSHLGAAPGSLWAIYPSAAAGFDQGQALTSARVTRMSGNDAYATLAVNNITLGANAVAASIATGVPTRELALDLRADAPLRAQLTTALQQRVSNLRIIAPGEAARFVVEANNRTIIVMDGAELGERMRFDFVSAADSAARLSQLFARSNNSDALRTLRNESSNMVVDVQVVTAPNDGDDQTRGITISPAKTAQYRLRRSGDERSHGNSLMLQITSATDAYLTIVYADSEGNVTTLLPNSQQSAAFLPAGLVRAAQTSRIPDALGDTNRAGFHWDYAPPAGEDTVTVFASRTPETAEKIRSYAALLAKTTRTRSIADNTAFERLRGELAEAAIGRGIMIADSSSSQAQPPSDWTAVSIDIRVEN